MTLALTVLAALSPVVAAAPDPAAATDTPNVRYQAVTELIYDEVDLRGGLQRPANQLVLERRRASFNPLVRLRTDFHAEMAESVQQVR
jgi:hypothetical protein